MPDWSTAQASLDRVRKLLESATDLGQILSLESQLTERETLSSSTPR